jgi:hypothetical protein
MRYDEAVAAGYELFLRAPDGATVAAADLARAVAAHAAPGLRAEPFVGEGGDPARPRGLDVALAEDGTPSALVDAAFALAQELGLDVYDPQVGMLVSAAEKDDIRARCDEVRVFLADTLGEAGAYASLPDPAPGSRSRLHLWLIVAGVIVAVLLLSRGCRALI